MLELQEQAENSDFSGELFTTDPALSLLTTCTSQLSAEVTCREMLDYFQARPELPGIIVLEVDQPIGIIPRNKLFAKLIKPYWRDMFNKRSVKALLEDEDFNNKPTILPHTSLLSEVIAAALSRPLHCQLDPIILADNKDYLLLDCQSFLLTQSHIFQTFHTHMGHLRQENIHLTSQLTESLEKFQALQTQLEHQESTDRYRQQILEHQNRELRSQVNDIRNQYNQLLSVVQKVSQQSQIALQVTTVSANNLSQELNQVFRFNGTLEQELIIMEKASSEIEYISRQVKHLALQASLIIARSGGQFNSFSFITSEINKLGDQCFDANKQLSGLANRLRQRLPELAQAVQVGDGTTRDLVNQIKPMKAILQELALATQQLEITSVN
ncbi:hypothetical protein RIF25_13180 [Thermosynechococcaceae cyanobacterium BACA0444]|uniref:Methyl-accepting transducer domain-containing protein n=1 Tax=Pseudocalidococcus azoricus BACA0444 TaxID=2918990 RepID=A0AAE4FVD8_9CYAN|nr:hypothetical protein [Pseudocalidococcus azoricus]MDS3861756.1 hypothetical protein [Pseudocalidococcus azoricus BACA0444]